jgi:hypothetical protein
VLITLQRSIPVEFVEVSAPEVAALLHRHSFFALAIHYLTLFTVQVPPVSHQWSAWLRSFSASVKFRKPAEAGFLNLFYRKFV